MPNWCSNSLQITSTPENIATLKQKLEECKGKEFFDIFVQNAEQAGKGEDWYAYNQETYGCKWNCDANDWDDRDGDGQSLTISFDSPWGPPLNLYETIARQDGFSVYATYYEPGMAFCGEWHDFSDDYYEFSGADSTTIRDFVPEHIDEMYCIGEQMAEYEAENAEDDEEEEENPEKTA